jgi:DNA repair exonuclease SbcCD ATPase subunit
VHDHRREIADALADSGRTDLETALHVLGSAARWAAHALGRLNSTSDGGSSDDTDGADALETLFALDDALADTRDLAAKALPELLAEARPGESVAQGTRDVMNELTAVTERVASQRAALESLVEREEEVRRRLAEHEKLRQEADELRRLERLAEELDGLQAQREVVDARLRELRGRDLGAADRELRTGADALLQLTRQQLSALEPRTQQTLEEATAAQNVLAATEHELSEVSHQLTADQDRLERIQEELERIQEEHGKVITSLNRYARADQELAQALRKAAGTDSRRAVPERGLSLEEVEALTRTVEEQLGLADQILSRVLADRQGGEEDGGTKVTGAQP